MTTSKKEASQEKNSESTEIFIKQIIDTLHDRALSTDIFPKKLKRSKKGKGTFSDWKDERTALNDYYVNSVCMDALFRNTVFKRLEDGQVPDEKRAFLSDLAIAKNQAQLQVLSLSAKNRAEFLSDRADFYPVFIGLIGAFIGYLAAAFPETPYKIVSYLIGLVLVGIALATRVPARRQVAELKMMANMLDIFEKKFPGLLAQAKKDLA